MEILDPADSYPNDLQKIAAISMMRFFDPEA